MASTYAYVLWSSHSLTFSAAKRFPTDVIILKTKRIIATLLFRRSSSMARLVFARRSAHSPCVCTCEWESRVRALSFNFVFKHSANSACVRWIIIIFFSAKTDFGGWCVNIYGQKCRKIKSEMTRSVGNIRPLSSLHTDAWTTVNTSHHYVCVRSL